LKNCTLKNFITWKTDQTDPLCGAGKEKLMKILIADDDFLTRQMLQFLLQKWEYEVIVVNDGAQAWQILQTEDRPIVAILDRVMPGMEGTEICRKIRELPHAELIYVILLTCRGHKNDIVEGLESGANDYITKPFYYRELRARVEVGRKIIELQSALAERVKQLEEAMEHVKMLQNFLPICSYCKKIRDDQNYWQQLEFYFATHADIKFSHGICPDCYEKYIKPEMDELKKLNTVSGQSKK